MVLSPEQTRAFLAAPVRVTEKFDGLNVGLCFTRGRALRFVSRAHGVLAPERLAPGLWPLVDFAYTHAAALLPLLGDRFVLFGEWLAGPRRLAYPRRTVDFVGFDLFDRARRAFLPAADVERRLRRAGLAPARARFTGRVDSVEALLARVPRSEFGGPAEGVVLERPDGRRAKVVRAGWARLPVRAPRPAPPPRTEPAPRRAEFRKRFAADRAAAAWVESTVLRALAPAKVAPRLLREERRPDGAVTLVLSGVGGRPFPRTASPELAAALGRQLAVLHARGGAATRALARRGAPVELQGGPPEHVRAASGPAREARALARFLSAQLGAAGRAPAVLCHGDLKPDNLKVQRGAVTLLDFERVCLADPAWELACAMDRLALSPAARAALLAGYAGRAPEPDLAVRVQCFRLAWDFALPRAVAALEAETGRRPGAAAVRTATRARARARRLAAALAC